MSIQNPVLYNCAAAGFLAGVLSERLSIAETDGVTPVLPGDFDDEVTAAFVFATECDTLLNAVIAGSPPTNIPALTNQDTFVTIVPGTAAVANAAESLPEAFVFICKAAWEKRFLPTHSDGTPYVAADYEAVANVCVSEFVEFCANCQTA